MSKFILIFVSINGQSYNNEVVPLTIGIYSTHNGAFHAMLDEVDKKISADCSLTATTSDWTATVNNIGSWYISQIKI